MNKIEKREFLHYGKLLFIGWLVLGIFSQTVVAQTHQVGDLISNSDGSRGIVFFVHPDGSGGWMVALTDASTGCAWGTATDISTLYNINSTTYSGSYADYYAALYDTAGYTNTQKIRAFQNNSTTYAAGKVDFANGWYLPSMGQLSELYGAQPFINTALTAAGGTILSSSGSYWSSSEYDASQSWYLASWGYSGVTSKTTNSYWVRAVRSFSNQTIVYDTTLTYLWSTGSTQPYITASPTTTTTYTVTATSGIGCSNSVTQTVFVNSAIPQIIYDTVCVGYPYQENGFNILASDNQVTGTTLHTRTVTQNGCQATVQLYLYKKPNKTATLNVTVCQGEQYYLNGIGYYNSGTYIQNLNSASGCDSTLTLHLAFYPAPTTVLNQTACNSYTWNGNTYTQSGDYTQSFTGHNGCDSTVTLHLTTHQTVYSTLKDTTCSGHPYTGFGFNIPATALASPGISYFKDTLTTQYGCDSIVTLLLTVHPNTASTVTQTVTENQLPHTFNGQTFTGEVTNHLITIPNANGCDSVISYTLHVNWNTTSHLSDTICQNSLPFIWNGITFNTAGTQAVTLTSHTGADSVVTMTLTVNPNTASTITQTVNENQLPITFNGQTFTGEVTNHLITIPNANGCDSVITYTLHVNWNTTNHISDTICQNSLPFIWNGITFNTAGTQSATLTSHTGADSVVTMTLTVNSNASSTITQTVNENQLPITFNRQTFNDSISNTIVTIPNANGCDSLITYTLHVNWNTTSHLTDTICQNSLPFVWNGITFNTAGTQSATLTSYNGADSVVTMTLTVHPNTSSTVTQTVNENQLPHTFNGQTFNDSISNTIVTIPNANGCDSVITYSLLVLWNTHSTVDTAICANFLPITWYGFSFTAAGSFNDTTLNSNGTDHITTYSLTVNTLPGINLSGFTNPICPFNTGTQNITAIVTSGLAPYQYLWQGDSLLASTISTDAVTVNLAGAQCGDRRTAFLTVTDANGCVAHDTATLNINDHTTPSTTGTFAAQPALASSCVFTVPNLITIVRNQSSDNCTPRDSLQISQSPAAGTTITGTQDATVTITDRCGSSTTIYINITVPATLTAVINNPTHILCNGSGTGAATVSVSGGTAAFSYHWQNASGTSISSTASVSNVPAGSYSVTVTDANGCSATTSVTLNTLNAAMNAGTIAQNQSICRGHSPATLTGTVASGGSNSTYQWQSSSNNTTFSPAVGTNNTQNYTPAALSQTLFFKRAWISTACGTVYSNVITITVFPTFNDTIQDHICEDYPYQDYGFNFSAEDNANPGTLIRTNTLQTVHGCDSAITLILAVMPSYYDTVRASVCQGQTYSGFGFNIPTDSTQNAGIFMQTQRNVSLQGGCDSLTTLLLTVNPAYDILLEEEVCEGQTYSAHGFDIPASETVGQAELTRVRQLQTANGCDSIARLNLSIIDTSITIISAQDFCDELSANLTVNTTLTDYHWNTDETTQSITVTLPGTYSVTASTGNCTATAQYVIPFCELKLYLPNAITPSDANGLNDYFCIDQRTQQLIGTFEIHIFNRLGELVFHSNDKNFRWYGDFHGQTFHNSIYNYVINCSNLQGRQYVFEGSINVL